MKMKSMKTKYIAVGLILSLFMTTCLTACSDLFTDDTGLGDTNYEDMEYVHYDSTKIQGMIDDCTALYSDKANAKEMLDEYDDIWDELTEVSKAYYLAQLHNYADVADQYYQDEFSYMDELYTDLYDQCCTLGHDILNSPCGKKARNRWADADIEAFEDYEEMTDEQKDLNKQENDLEMEYNEKAVQSFTVSIDGEEYTLSEIPDLYTSGAVSLDQYYQYIDEIYQKENAALGPIYVEMVKVRQQIAKTYGYDSYTEYAYTEIYDRDYTPEQTLSLCEEVKDKLVEPAENFYYLMDSADEEKVNQITDNMTEDQWISMVKSKLTNVDSSLKDNFEYMQEHNLYDLEDRENKYDGGFTVMIPGYDEPYLFITPGSGFYDVMTLVHEFGHYNAYCENVDEGATENLDLAEIHSQGLELLYIPYYGEMLGDENLTEYCEAYCMYQRCSSVTEGCLYDEFQQQVYALEDPTLDQINEIFGDLAGQYGYSWGETNKYLWVDVSHTFDSPFYYISYAISALPALEIWEKSTKDYDKAVKTYLRVVDEGESGEYLETLDDCGLTSPFEDGYIDDLVDTLNENFY